MRLAAVHSLALAALAAAACDTTPPRGRDASAGSQRLSEVAVRLEVVGDGAPTASVLAYRASASGIGTDDVLSVVDPLTAPAPEGACTVRDVASAARSLGALGGRVDLEALFGLRLDLGAGSPALSPSARVYPELASVVGGVVAEAGPVELNAAPIGLAVIDGYGNRAGFALPGQPRLIGPDGEALPGNATLTVTGDLVLGITSPGPASMGPTFLELRPFGATWALACPLTGRDRVVVPATEVARLASLRVPISVEAVARESHPLSLGGATTRVTLELRSSSVVELRP
jgi:predicted small secreted protein